VAQIIAENLIKTYRVAERTAGLAGAVAGLVRRRHREVRALDGVTFSIAAGELVGYIGPNGAGKSTTVKILSGILVPDGGRCEVDGLVPWRERVRHVARIGVVFGQRTQLWWDLPVIESFDLLRDVYRIEAGSYRAARDELVERLALAPLLDTPVRQLSLGQRMRCDVAASLLHEPALVFLDEPTIGLDAVAKLAVREFVRGLNRDKGTTVILTTHDMDDIEALCTRVLVIGRGRILCDDTIGGLRALVSPERRLVVDLAAPVRPTDLGVDGATVESVDGLRVSLSFDPGKVTAPELIARVSARYPVRDLFVENPPIEQIIAQLYRAHGEADV
jgi:ABC-2 type transport system ATP-binding protein